MFLKYLPNKIKFNKILENLKNKITNNKFNKHQIKITIIEIMIINTCQGEYNKKLKIQTTVVL